MLRVAATGYDVTIARGALASAGDLAHAAVAAHRYAIITDASVAALYATRVAASLRRTLGDGGTDAAVLTVPPGEHEKTRASWERLTDELLALGIGRDGAVIALGGGVIGDLAGFVAATFMRGIPYVQIPTTLLAMVDASIGGKTGVDTAAGKNLVGAFHQPAAVIIDPDALATLPLRHLRAGLAEMLKHGVVADAAYFETMAADLETLLASPEAPVWERAIGRSVELKADVVRRDEREGGLRKVLNFGHTIGHGVEAGSDYRLLHGEAVAIGMALEGALAERLGVAQRGTAARITSALERAGLPVERPRDITAERVLEFVRSDKKSRSGCAEYALPRAIGAMAGEERGWAIRVDDAVVREILG